MITPLNTRFAPSPTGHMHIGGCRTAYFNYLAARASGGKFILRVDDTDTEREVEGAVDVILNSMKWLGLDFDDSFYQSHNRPLYTHWAQLLVNHGFATVLDNGAIALKWHDFMPRTWVDDIAGEIAVSDKEMEMIDGLILVKGGDKLGQAIYHFASVVDDYTSNINCIIRGTDHISNTAKQLAIWAAMNAAGTTKRPFPRFAHVGLIHKDKKKISKRDVEQNPFVYLSYYAENGYEPEAVLNFLLRLGFGPTKDDASTAIITKERAIEMFLTEGKMRSAPANFDMAKLQSFDRKYKGRRENAARLANNKSE